MTGIWFALAIGQQGRVLYPEADTIRLPSYVRAPQFQQEFPRSTIYSNDPLLMIQSINSLMPLGESKVLKTIRGLDEYFQSWSDAWWPYWLTRVLFVGKDPSYVPPAIGEGQMSELRPVQVKNWPSYPKIIVDGVPIHLQMPSSDIRGGGAEDPGDFATYLDANQKEWRLRKGILVPPDDPFPILQKCLSTPMPIERQEVRQQVAKQILLLVRTVYYPQRYSLVAGASTDDIKYEQIHQEFLKLGGHWNQRLNVYVRKDGTFDKDSKNTITPVGYEFTGLPGMKVRLNFKFEERNVLSWSVDCFEVPNRSIPSVVVVARNAKTNQEIGWLSPNCVSQLLPGDVTKEQILLEPNHSGTNVASRKASTVDLPMTDPIQFELHIGSKVIKSPPINL